MSDYKVKVIGAGSIGNHLANASRAMGWSVDMCDASADALKRAKEVLYPSRYGRWDDKIRLFTMSDAPRGGYDIIIIGTPPDSHNALALTAIEERPRAILIEKPVCTPDLENAQKVIDLSQKANIATFVGYDHVVGVAAKKVEELLAKQQVGNVLTIDVETREHWGGILTAHPWLGGPWDTYLGFWKRGGGACGEHSHAANLWQRFAHVVGAGRIVEVTATLDYIRDGKIDCDRLALLNVVTEKGLVGRVIQDTVTQPTRKMARIQGDAGYIEWHCGLEPGADGVLVGTAKGEDERLLFKKTRPDDFIEEMKQIDADMAKFETSPLSLRRGLDTMLVVAAAHKSAQEKKTIAIDYSKGYTLDALKG